MAKIFLFPERGQSNGHPQASASGTAGEIVPLRGTTLESTLEMVAFLRSLDDQSCLDRFNRARPVERDVAVERHRASLASERS